jgi:biotin synthase-like enzyme
MTLLNKAYHIYCSNFPPETWFERAIFISWYCAKPTCRFCYMHSIKDKIKNPRLARRRKESIFAETLIAKICGWEIGFISAGIASFSAEELKEILEGIYRITEKKQWLNLGTINQNQIKTLLPFIEGLTGTVECVNMTMRKDIVPDKPFENIDEMFKLADEFKLKKAITIIIGLGETIDDFSALSSLIRKWNIDRVNFYRLVPHENTPFKEGPSIEYYSEWIAKTRIEFPKIMIVAGSWADKTAEIPVLLKAGANAITKLPAIKYFGKKPAIEIEQGAKKAGRKFLGTLTKYPKVDIEDEVEKAGFDSDMGEKIKKKYMQYTKKFIQKN